MSTGAGAGATAIGVAIGADDGGCDVVGALTSGAVAAAVAALPWVVTNSPAEANTTAHAAPANNNAGRWYHGSAGCSPPSTSWGR